MALGVIGLVIPLGFNQYFAGQQARLTAEWKTAKKSRPVVAKPAVSKPKRRPTLADIEPGPALLNVPSIGVEVAVVSGTSQFELAKGPGIVEKTARPGEAGNVAIAGHRTMYGAPFRRLDEIKKGDDLLLRLPGADLLYKVNEIRRVRPKDTSVLDNVGDNRLTLISCDPPFSAALRIVVIGKLKNISATGGKPGN